MKKFTKVCLLTALILFILGCLICGVCGLSGGFRQLRNLNGIAGIPFVYHRGIEFGFFDHDEDKDWVRDDWEKREADGNKEKLTATVDTLRNIEIDVTDCYLLIMESEDDHVWISVNGKTQETYYKIEPDSAGRECLYIRNTRDHRVGNWWTDYNDTITLYLPKGCDLDSVIIELGAGLMVSTPLKAVVIDIVVGAGTCDVQMFEGESVNLVVGAGQIETDALTADTAALTIEAGQLVVKDMSVNDLMTVGLGMGSARVAGTITGNLNVECNMGELDMELTGSEDDHGYIVDCGMGEVKAGSTICAGLTSEKSWNTEKDSLFTIDCSMGSVAIRFDK